MSCYLRLCCTCNHIRQIECLEMMFKIFKLNIFTCRMNYHCITIYPRIRLRNVNCSTCSTTTSHQKFSIFVIILVISANYAICTIHEILSILHKHICRDCLWLIYIAKFFQFFIFPVVLHTTSSFQGRPLRCLFRFRGSLFCQELHRAFRIQPLRVQLPCTCLSKGRSRCCGFLRLIP